VFATSALVLPFMVTVNMALLPGGTLPALPIEDVTMRLALSPLLRPHRKLALHQAY
jgi:hypothetical protein